MAGPFDFLRNNGPYGPSSNLLGVGLGLLSGRTAQEQVANAATNFANDRQMGQTYNKTLEYLKQSYPDLASAVESGAIGAGDAFKMAYQQKIEAAKPKNNFMSVGKNLYNVDSGEWVTPPAGIGGDEDEWGLNPVWGEVDGKTVLGQLSKSGKFKPLDTGDFNPTPTLQTIDTGTSILGRNSRTGAVVTETPKNLAEAEAQKKLGQFQGEATASAPGDIQAGQNALDLIGSIRDDPNRGIGTGLSSVGNRIPATPGYDFQTKVDQAKSGAFLSAIEQMRGLGALSNAEGQTATAAVTRMNTATSESEFLAALSDYEKIIKQGIGRAQNRLSGQQPAQGPAQAPGSVVDYTDYFKQ